MKRMLPVVLMLLASVQAHAAIHTEVVEYHHNDVVLEGFLAYDDAREGRRPGVLVAHEWKGLNDYAKRRAEQLAGLGYIAFAADIYGQGVRAKDHEEAPRLAGIYKQDRQLMRGRVRAALETLAQHPLSDAERPAAIGYCFGGTAVLELLAQRRGYGRGGQLPRGLEHAEPPGREADPGQGACAPPRPCATAIGRGQHGNRESFGWPGCRPQNSLCDVGDCIPERPRISRDPHWGGLAGATGCARGAPRRG